MAWATSDSFAGLGINVLAEGRSRQARAKVSVREIPGGDTVVVNNGGLGVRRRSYTLYVPTDTILSQLEDLCGAEADLVYWGGSFRGILEELDAADWWTGGQQRVRATFVVLSQTAYVPPTLPPTACFTYTNTGLAVTLDLNCSTSPDDLLDEYNVEWGDAATSTYNTGAPWAIGAVPTIAHTYAEAGTYVVTVSVERSSVLSPDYSALVEVEG